jgi:hypothetical protein
MAFVCRLADQLASALPTAPADAWRSVVAIETLQVFAESRTTQTAAVLVPGFGRVVRKRWTWPRRRDRMKGALRTTFAARSPARREFDALARLRALTDGAFAPEPLGFAEHREGGVLVACVLLVAEIEGAVDLARWLRASRPGRARTRVLRHLARRARAMHDAGLVDFEMHPRNVLVAPATGGVFKVDCAKQRRRTGTASRRDRVRDLAALDVGLSRLATRDERTGFLAAYLGPAATPDDVRALAAAVDRERLRVDVRESARLPAADK